MTARTFFLLIGTSLALAACSGSATNTETPPPPPPPTQHLYVGDDQTTGALRSYALPIAASSTPAASVGMNSPFTIGLNSTTLAVADLNSNLYWFTLPLTSTSTPYAMIAAGSDGTPIFTPAGTLYQGGIGKINVYTPPFTSSSTPSSSITTTGLSPDDMAIDPNGNVYETTGGNTIGVVTGGVLTTTLTAPVGTQFRGLAATSSQLFACEFVSQGSRNIYVYSLPLTASATPAVIINLGSYSPEGCAVDADGNLYMGSSDGTVLEFKPPFTSASVPAVTLTTPAVIFGIAIGK